MKLEHKVGMKAGITDVEKRPLSHMVADMGATEWDWEQKEDPRHLQPHYFSHLVPLIYILFFLLF